MIYIKGWGVFFEVKIIWQPEELEAISGQGLDQEEDKKLSVRVRVPEKGEQADRAGVDTKCKAKDRDSQAGLFPMLSWVITRRVHTLEASFFNAAVLGGEVYWEASAMGQGSSKLSSWDDVPDTAVTWSESFPALSLLTGTYKPFAFLPRILSHRIPARHGYHDLRFPATIIPSQMDFFSLYVTQTLAENGWDTL